MTTQDTNGISWTQETWHPLVGCTKCSPGCEHCWAEALHTRRHKAFLAGKKVPRQYAKPFSEIQLLKDRLPIPLLMRKSRMIAVGLQTDLFHPDIPIHWQEQIFRTMISANHHTFQILTKRPYAMASRIPIVMNRIFGAPDNWTMPRNIWLGVSVENQQMYDDRIYDFLEIPAAVRFISVEPMLGQIIMTGPELASIDWVIVGGETGPGARPMHPDWVRSLRDQCQAASVPFHFKQWGEWARNPYVGGNAFGYAKAPRLVVDRSRRKQALDEWTLMERVGKRKAGRLLDGREWLEFPASSWRNEIQQEIVSSLRSAGHEVYDFRNPVPGCVTRMIDRLNALEGVPLCR